MSWTTELASMRETQEDFMPDTCTRSRRIMDKDDLGAANPAWGTVSYSCRIGTPNQVATLQPAGITDVSNVHAVATLPVTADVEAHDRITAQGTEYEVIDIVVTSYQTALRALLRKVE